MNRKTSLVLGLALIVVLAVPPLILEVFGASPSDQAKELKQIKQRAASLASRLGSSNLAEARAAQKDWDKLILELRRWERKFGVQPQVRRHKPASAPMGGEKQGGGGGAGGTTAGGSGGGGNRPGLVRPCAQQTESDGFWCLLQSTVRDADGSIRCVYRCYKI